jgi:hypothetical protein
MLYWNVQACKGAENMLWHLARTSSGIGNIERKPPCASPRLTYCVTIVFDLKKLDGPEIDLQNLVPE